MGIEMSKIVDVIVGIMVLIFAINIAVLPVAKNTLGPLFSIGEQTKQYLNDTGGKDFTAFDIEKSYGIAGVSIMDFLFSVEELSKTVDNYVNVITNCEKITSITDDKEAFLRCREYNIKTGVHAGDIAGATMQEYLRTEGLKIKLEKEKVNQKIRDTPVFGEPLTKDTYNKYLCNYYMNASKKRLNSFVYFRESPGGLWNLNCDGTIIQLLFPEGNIEQKWSYRISVAKNTYMLGNIISFTSMRSRDGTMKLNLHKTENSNVGCTQYYGNDFNFIRDCYVVGFELPERIPYSDKKGDLYKDLLRKSAVAFRSPSYVFYYEALPENEELAWKYDYADNVMTSILWGGVANAAFDLVSFLKLSTWKLASAEVKSAFKATKAGFSKAASEIGEEIIEEGAESFAETTSIITVRKYLQEGMESANEQILEKNVRKAVFFEQIGDDIGRIAGKYNIPSEQVDILIRNIDTAVEAAQKSGVDLAVLSMDNFFDASRAVVPGTKGPIKSDMAQVIFKDTNLAYGGTVSAEILKAQEEILETLAKKSNRISSTTMEKLLLETTLERESKELITDMIKEGSTAKVLSRLKGDSGLLKRFDGLSPSDMSIIEKNFDSYFENVNLDDMDISIRDLFSESSSLKIDAVEEDIAKTICSTLKCSDGVPESSFFKKVFDKVKRAGDAENSMTRRLLLQNAIMLFNWANSMGYDKTYPSKENYFVLYDPTMPGPGRKRTFDISSSVYINIDKYNNNRFYLASPCKADLRVRTDICTCDVTSGAELLKNGPMLIPATGLKGYRNEYFFFDYLSQAERDKLTKAMFDLSQNSAADKNTQTAVVDLLKSKYKEPTDECVVSLKNKVNAILKDKKKIDDFITRLRIQTGEDMFLEPYESRQPLLYNNYDKISKTTKPYCYLKSRIGSYFLDISEIKYDDIQKMFCKDLSDDECRMISSVWYALDTAWNFDAKREGLDAIFGSWAKLDIPVEMPVNKRPMNFYIDYFEELYDLVLKQNVNSGWIIDQSKKVKNPFMYELFFETISDPYPESSSDAKYNVARDFVCIRDSISDEEFNEIYSRYRTDFDTVYNTPSYDGYARDIYTFTFFELKDIFAKCENSRVKVAETAKPESLVKSGDELLLRGWAGYFKYINKDDKDKEYKVYDEFTQKVSTVRSTTDTSEMIQYCNPPGKELLDKAGGKPLDSFIVPDSESLKKYMIDVNDADSNFRRTHFIVTIPCVDVKVDNANYLDYNNNFNFCHLSYDAKHAESLKKGIALMLTAFDIGLSIVMPQSVILQPIASFTSGFVQAEILRGIDDRVAWPNTQMNRWDRND